MFWKAYLIWAGCLGVALPCVATGAVPSVTLVENGAPRCAIVISATPTQSARDAAKELAHIIKLKSDANVPVFEENKLPESDRPEVLVLIGDSQRSQSLGF